MNANILFAFYFLGGVTPTPNTAWKTSFDEAKAEAAVSHKYILLSFSGSDWCIPCIKMEETMFDHPSFKNFAADKLVLVKADFPRMKKNQLPADQKKKNDLLAEKFNPNGVFPLTIILSPTGKKIYSIEGYPKGTVTQFINSLEEVIK